MQSLSKKTLSLLLCASLVAGTLGIALLLVGKGKADSTTYTNLSLNTAVSVNCSGGSKNYKFTAPKTALYEFYTYNNTGDPTIMTSDGMYGFSYTSDSGLGNNEYGIADMTQGSVYYFTLDDSVKGSFKFVVKNVSDNAESFTPGTSKTLSVDTTSGVKWFKFTPLATYTDYRFTASSGEMQMYLDSALMAKNYNVVYSSLNPGESGYDTYWIGNFTTKDSYYFNVRNISGNSVTISTTANVTNKVTATDASTSLTGVTRTSNTSSNSQNVSGSATTGKTIALTVNGSVSDGSTPIYSWTDAHGTVLGSSKTYNYTVASTNTITCTVKDKYGNSARVIYTITATAAANTYKVTLDIKNGSKAPISLASSNEIKSGNSYSGTKKLVITSTQGCRVYMTGDGGKTYSQIKGTSAGTNTYAFSVNVSKAITLVVVKPGDSNLDGSVDSSDALQMLRYDVGKTSFGVLEKLVADMTGEGTIDSSDALLALRYDVGKANLSW